MIEHGTMIPLQASKRPLYDLRLHNTHMQLCNVNSNKSSILCGERIIDIHKCTISYLTGTAHLPLLGPTRQN